VTDEAKAGFGGLASVVYERTAQGLHAAKALEDGSVPANLRTLLLAVDGRTPVEQFLRFLPGLAPLPDKFLELEQMGLVRRKSGQPWLDTANAGLGDILSGPGGPGSSAAAAVGAEGGSFFGAEGVTLARLRASFAPAAAATEAPSLSAFDAELKLLEQMMGSASAGPSAAPTSPPPALRRPATLRDLQAEMNRFLSSTAGLDSLPLAMVVEQIQTVAQLRQELPSYAELLQAYGAPARQHLDTLANMLVDAR
jgi:hypothetical protein